MNTVEPIRDPDMLQRFYEIASRHDAERKRKSEVSWSALLLLGFGTALRISDIRRLRVRDVRGEERVDLRAQKTGKWFDMALQPEMIRELKQELKGRDPDEFILSNGSGKPISRQRAYQILNIIGEKAGFTDHIGCHTLRKTYGYTFYQETKDIEQLRSLLGHSTEAVTRRYIGIDRDTRDACTRGIKGNLPRKGWRYHE